MARAFPERSDCPDVPDNEAISGSFVIDTLLCSPPPPIFEFPVYEFPPPEPPSADFGCYEPSVSTLFEISTNPLFEGSIDFENSSETGKCEPKFKFHVKIPPCALAATEVTTSTVPALTEPSASFAVFRNQDPGDVCKLKFKLRLYFPAFSAATGCTAKAASTGNLTLSGNQTVDGTSLTTGDSVLVKNQTTGSENGVYTVQSGAWTRTCTMQSGLIVSVRQGTQNGGTAWILTTEDPITIGSTSLTFEPIGTSCCCYARVATTVNITLSGLQTIDGVSVAANEAVLVKNQTTGSQNGVYLAKSGAWERTCDIQPGLVVSVREGDQNKRTLWMLITNAPITVGSTTLTFEIVRAPGNATVDVATTTNITLSGLQTIDGVSLSAGQKVLVKDQSTASQNGVYIVASGAWTRSGDPIVAGMMVTVRKGGLAIAQVFTLTTDEPITVGSTSLTFASREGIVTARASSTVNIASLSGTMTIDGISLVAGDIALVKNQTTASQNGVYTVNSGAWTRVSEPMRIGLIVAVRQGTLNGRSFWVADTATPTFLGMGAFFR